MPFSELILFVSIIYKLSSLTIILQISSKYIVIILKIIILN